MAAGGTVVGAAAFVAIKFVGYSIAGGWLKSKGATAWRPLGFGLARTLLGIGVGSAFAGLVGRFDLDPGPWFYLILLPVRYGEWLLMLRIAAPRGAGAPSILGRAGFGSLWSYFLDLPAILAAFTVPGGFWVC